VPFQLVPMLLPATISSVAPSTAIAFQIWMRRGWRGIDSSLTVAPLPSGAAPPAYMASTSARIGPAKPFLNDPDRRPRACPVSLGSFRTQSTRLGGSSPSAPASTSRSWRHRGRYGRWARYDRVLIPIGEDLCMHKPVGGFVATAPRKSWNSDRPSLVAPDGHVALAGDRRGARCRWRSLRQSLRIHAD